LTPPAQSSQKSDNQWELMMSDHARLASNGDAVTEWIKSVGLSQRRVDAAEELRYADRQMDRARECADKKDFNKAREHLEQANENMHKALHDAIDDAVGFIGAEKRRYADKWGVAKLNDHFRHYQALSGVLIRTKRQIASSRENREQRGQLYRDIAEGAEDFKDLLKYFDELRSSETAIHESIADKKRQRRNSILTTVLIAAVGNGLAIATLTLLILDII